MRHQRRINKLSRTSEHRSAMLSNMATSLIVHKRIFTTLAKAKALRSFVEPLITKSKEDSTHSRRVVFSYLGNKEAVNELFREVSVKVGERPGGYTRIIKTGKRLGDNAEMAMIELVDFNPNLLGGKEAGDKGKKRSRRGTSKKKTEVTATTETTAKAKSAEVVAPIEESVVEEVIEEVAEPEVETTEAVEAEAEVEVAEVAETEVEEVVEEPEAVAEAEPEAVSEPEAEMKTEDAAPDAEQAEEADDTENETKEK